MATTMNICGLTPVDDPSYRYKMPAMTTKIEGRGNGIKTVLTNIHEVSLSLNREAPEITKFFGCELGSQTTFENQANSIKAIVNGAQTTADMQNLLKVYIEKFVLCKQCHLPETRYKVKNNVIHQSCAACGAKEQIDMTHKLTTFILKSYAAKKAEKSKEEKDDKKDGKKKSEKSSIPTAASPEALSPIEKVKSSEKKKKDKKKDGEETVLEFANEADDNATEDVSDEAALNDAIERFKAWHASTVTTTQVVLDELKSIQTLASLQPSFRHLIVMGALFTENAVTKHEVTMYKDIFNAMMTNEIQKRQLIAGLEWFCGVRCKPLQRFFPVLLKQFYDEDVLDEDIILMWDADSTPNDFSVDESLVSVSVLEQMKASAKPFITWLEEAEEEEDDA